MQFVEIPKRRFAELALIEAIEKANFIFQQVDALSLLVRLPGVTGMSMFQVSGVVLHLFDAPGRIDKDTGEVDDDKSKVQLLGETPT